MPKSVCVKCEQELECEKNGVVVVEMMHQNTEIYKLWEADLWKCGKCKVEVVLGFGNQPYMEHYEGDIQATLQKLVDDGRVIVYDKEVCGADNI